MLEKKRFSMGSTRKRKTNITIRLSVARPESITSPPLSCWMASESDFSYGKFSMFDGLNIVSDRCVYQGYVWPREIFNHHSLLLAWRSGNTPSLRHHQQVV